MVRTGNQQPPGAGAEVAKRFRYWDHNQSRGEMGTSVEPAWFQDEAPEARKYCSSCEKETGHEIRVDHSGKASLVCVACAVHALDSAAQREVLRLLAPPQDRANRQPARQADGR